MKLNNIRKSFIKFFVDRGHKNLPPSSIIPENDPSVLFTTAGMQQFKPYYLDPKKSLYKNVTTCQPCVRTSDIEEVGDDTHLTMLEMLGNFSFDGYFKYDAIRYAWEFITEVLKIDKSRIHVTVFAGDKLTPLDSESIRIWREIGVSDSLIKMGGREDNFWGPTGSEGPCGPTTEIYVDGVEIWNIVFNEYYYENETFTELAHPGIDTGMGLERIAVMMQSKKSVYDIDSIEPIMQHIKHLADKTNTKSERIIADHARTIAFLINAGIIPSNKEHGYILRRLIRRMVVHADLIGLDRPTNSIIPIAIQILKDPYYDLVDQENKILEIALTEEEKFSKTLKSGLNKLNKELAKNPKNLKGDFVFLLYDSFGFPLELTEELASQKNIKIDKSGFNKKLDEQKERSRTAAKGLFKGGLIGTGEQEIKYHTATHLLQAALRHILGNDVHQMGSNINSERLRFDFSYPQKMTDEQIKKTEDLVNEQIKKNLPVKMEEMSLKDARSSAAIGLFTHKYGNTVKVYSIGDFSIEICGGPHVASIGELGKFKITKEESSSSGVRRIKAILE